MRIGFGMTFRVRGEKDRVDLIFNVAKDSYFYATRLRGSEEEPLTHMHWAGTADKENIAHLLPRRYSLQEVIAAYKRAEGEKLPKDVLKLLTKYSQAPDREI